MMPTRLSTLLSLFVGVAALTWGVLGTAETRGAVLPPVPFAAPLPIAALGVAVLVSAVALRRRLRGAPGTKPPHPIGVARLAVLWKTSSHVAAILAGVYAGYVLLLLRNIEAVARRDRAVVAVIALSAAGLLLLAGLVLERACRVPPSDDDASAASDG